MLAIRKMQTEAIDFYTPLTKKKKKAKIRAGEMVGQLRACISFTEDLVWFLAPTW